MRPSEGGAPGTEGDAYRLGDGVEEAPLCQGFHDSFYGCRKLAGISARLKCPTAQDPSYQGG